MAPRLRVSAGPSVDRLTVVGVNDEDNPTVITSDDFEGRIAVRIENFTGVRAGGQSDVQGLSTGYFDHGHAKGCTWSIQIQGRFKKGVCVDEVEYGNQFDRPIRDRLPWGTSVALRAISIIDPSLRHDVYCDKPWAFGPLITSMTRVNVVRRDKEEQHNVHQDGQPNFALWPPFPKGKDEEDYVREDTSVLLCQAPPKANELRTDVEEAGLADRSTLSQLRDPHQGHTHRARFWSNQAAREACHFLSDDVITMAFDNGFIDFNTLRAVLPYTGGMGFDLQQYWDGQPVRYYCKRSPSDEVFFVIEFQIVEKDE